MRFRKRDRWIVMAVVAAFLLVILLVWLPISGVQAQGKASGSSASLLLTVQASPTGDATVTALRKEKLAQEVQLLKNRNELDPFGWVQTNASVLLSTLVVVIGGLIGLWRWRIDRRDAQDKVLDAQRIAQDKELKAQQHERDKRAEERFQRVVEGFGSDNEGAKVGAAIVLRTFLGPDYEQFYRQTYELAVAYLRLPRTPGQSSDPDAPVPLTTLTQTLMTIFRESFPLNRDRLQQIPQFSGAEPVRSDTTYLSVDEMKNTWMPYLDASYVQLDHAYLSLADLKNAWMPQAKLRKADLWRADLREANLRGADLRDAFLWNANLHETDLRGADLRGAYLRRADGSNARLGGADLGGADITRTNLTGVDMSKVNNLTNTRMAGVKGLTQEQLDVCRARGAILDEEYTNNASQSTISTSLQ